MVVFLIGFVGTLFSESAELLQAEKRLVNNPDDERALYNVGVLAFREGDIQKAADAFSCLKPRCEKGHIDSVRAEQVFYNAGNAEMKLEKYAEAEKSFEAALRYNASNDRAREKRDLARLLQKQQQQQEQSQQEENQQEQNQQEKAEKQQQEQQNSQEQKEQQGDQQKEQKESSQKREQDTKENKNQQQQQEQQKKEEGTAAHLGGNREQDAKNFTAKDKQFLCRIDQLDRQGNQELTRYRVECMKGQDARHNW